MTKLTILLETLERFAAMASDLKAIDSTDNRKVIESRLRAECADYLYKPDFNALVWAHLYGAVKYKLEDVARSSQRVVDNSRELVADIALMERLQAVMEDLDLHVYTHELKLLELLVNDSTYRIERSELRLAISKALIAVEYNEQECEYESTVEALDARFDRNNDDWLDGASIWCRTVDSMVEKVVIRACKEKNFAYQFEYEKETPNGAVLMSGKSGEFAKLLEVAGITPVAA